MITWKESACKPTNTTGAYNTDFWKQNNHKESKIWVKTILGLPGQGTNAGALDKCYSGEVEKKDWANVSIFTWDIPWVYLRKGDEKEEDGTLKPASKGKLMFDVQQEWESDAMGTCTISKPTLNVFAKKAVESADENDPTIIPPP